MASRLQSIVRCLIQMQSLHISQIAVNSDIAYRKGTLTSWTSPSIAMPPFCNSYFHYIRDIQERSTVKTNENITNIKENETVVEKRDARPSHHYAFAL